MKFFSIHINKFDISIAESDKYIIIGSKQRKIDT